MPSFEDLIRASWTAPPARDAFRSDLRTRFAAQGAFPAGEARPEVRGVRRGPRPLAPRVLAWAGAVAAAAVLLLLFGPREASAPARPWRLVEEGSAGAVRIGGELVPVADAERVRRAVEQGVEVASTDDRLELYLDDDLRLQLMPLTRFRSVPVAEQVGTPSADTPVLLDLSEGELLLLTRPHAERVDRPPIVVRTPDTRVTLTGTGISVKAMDAGTCVCVARGEVRIEPRESAPRVGRTRTTCFVFRDGSEPFEGDFEEMLRQPGFDPEHQEVLLDFVAEGLR